MTLALAACTLGGLTSGHREALRQLDRLSVPDSFYYGVAWVRPDAIALVSERGLNTAISLVDREGNAIGSLPLPARPQCSRQTLLAFARLPTGDLGFADACEVVGSNLDPQSSDLMAMDTENGRVEQLGHTAQKAVAASWRHDMRSAIYTALGSLCATLYEHDGRDGPVGFGVVIDGHQLPAGEDVNTTADGCTQQTIANYPAFAPLSDSLAFFAAAVGETNGQGRIDLPWGLFVLDSHGTGRSILGGIGEPRSLFWVDEETLIFSAKLAGLSGVWTIRRDGTQLTRVLDRNLDWMTLAPDGSAIAGIIYPDNVPPDNLFTEVYEADLRLGE